MKVYITALLLLFAGSSVAQLKVFPHPQSAQGSNKLHTIAGLYKKADAAWVLANPGDTLSLPFWDDFSYRGQELDSVKWPFNTTNTISYGMAINPPSWGVVTFDGISALGQPYSSTSSTGVTDSIESAPIALGTLSAEEQASTFLSFYWQLQGRGDRPDKSDFLRLYFLDSEGRWHQVWSQSGDKVTDAALFTQQMISLKNEGDNRGVNFFHDGFKFKFQSESRQSGQFDQWHLDWIYLNKGRRADNIYYEDRAISDAFTSLFSPYTAIPKDQLFANPAGYLKDQNLFVVHSLSKPGIDEVLTYDLGVYTGQEELVKMLETDRLLISDQGSLLKGQGYFTEDASGLSVADLAPLASKDSFELVTRLVLKSEEPLAFFHRNDSIEIRDMVSSYFAYDDGTAEISVHLNGRNEMLAYAFTLEEQDTLTAISFYSPSFNTSLRGSNLDLKIWTQLEGIDGAAESKLIYTQNVTVVREGVNNFTLYKLNSPQVLTAGKFYIGFEQVTSDPVAFGFDLNTNSSGNLFQNTSGFEWQPVTNLTGSLMMRPYFQPLDTLILGIKETIIFPPTHIYPNPTRNSLWVESEAKALRLYDPQGRLVLEQPASPCTQLALDHLQPGLYLLQLEYKKGVQMKRVLVIE